ncbi:MAG: DegV family protein, partial [Dehalococcoidia bacterium]|nr:DegV family protein [Dehalococcoidia bacterium]
MAVHIVTDSTADLPREVVQRLGITVVPLNLHFSTQVYRDGVDIQAEEFYRRLVTANPLPTTSQPAVGAFVECYQALADTGEPVVSIHVASKLSGTYNSAFQAREQVGTSMFIEVVDSQTASMGLGLIVLAAAEAAAAGASLEEVLHATREAVARTRVLFMVDTLEYLQRGGRIGKAQAFLGSVLNIKPIL